MSEEPRDAVELQLVASAQELSPALEAAQFAHLVQPEEAETEQETEAIAGFLDAFSACTEVWDRPSDERPLALGRLGSRIEALEALGLYVHAGCVRAELDQEEAEGVSLPLAVVTISRSTLPTVKVLLPADVRICTEGRTLH